MSEQQPRQEGTFERVGRYLRNFSFFVGETALGGFRRAPKKTPKQRP